MRRIVKPMIRDGLTSPKNNRNELSRQGSRPLSPPMRALPMLKFLGSTVGIIFLIGLIVVIALLKFIF
jgi:hypothetical protein